MNESEGVRRYYRGEVRDYADQYAEDYSGYPANTKRLNLILGRVAVHRPRTLLDCGCGEASPMSRLDDAHVEVWGFDFVDEMVAQAKLTLAPKGMQDRVWLGDITDLATFWPVGREVPKNFDMTIAMGVFPHLRDEVGALRHKRSMKWPELGDDVLQAHAFGSDGFVASATNAEAMK